jgi:4-diphosphocytidyl-2-C-methyl-D-erythritol kinase
MSALRAAAPAKVNLGLWLGPVRAYDARHELVSVMQSISLADEVTLAPCAPGAGRDEVSCPGVPGAAEENLATRALKAFRDATGRPRAPQRLTIVKRIPVAAGLGGGSADAGATLRLLRRATGAGDERLLAEIAQSLGADVPAQVTPGRWLAGGAGERLERLPAPSAPLELLVLPLAGGLSTAAVYREADRLGLSRTTRVLARRASELREALAGGDPLPQTRLLHNDLQRAACSLQPAIQRLLAEARDAGAPASFVSGSGPTVVAAFAGPGARGQARRAAALLSGRVPSVLRARSVAAGSGRVRAAAVPVPAGQLSGSPPRIAS